MAKTISQLPAATTPFDGSELFEVVQGGASKQAKAGSTIPMKTPASATATGTQGQVCWDANYIYVCVAANSWKRAAIAAW